MTTSGRAIDVLKSRGCLGPRNLRAARRPRRGTRRARRLVPRPVRVRGAGPRALDHALSRAASIRRPAGRRRRLPGRRRADPPRLPRPAGPLRRLPGPSLLPADGRTGRRPARAPPAPTIVPALRMNEIMYFRPFKESRGDRNVVRPARPVEGHLERRARQRRALRPRQRPARAQRRDRDYPDVAAAMRTYATDWFQSCGASASPRPKWRSSTSAPASACARWAADSNASWLRGDPSPTEHGIEAVPYPAPLPSRAAKRSAAHCHLNLHVPKERAGCLRDPPLSRCRAGDLLSVGGGSMP